MSDLAAAARGRLAERLVPVAMELAGVVRDQDAAGIGEFLARLGEDEREALLVVLAAMVPVDQTPQELLAWVGWDWNGRPLPPGAQMVLWSPRSQNPRYAAARPVQPCGTIAAYQRHRNYGEEPCEDCKRAKGDYTAQRRAALRQTGGSAA